MAYETTWAQAKAKLKKAKVRSEQSIQEAVVGFARELGWRVTKRSHASAFGSNGEPDYEFAALARGGGLYFFLIEFKKKGNVPTEKQEAMIEEWRALDVRVYVVDDAKEGKAIVQAESHRARVNKRWQSTYRKQKAKRTQGDQT